MSKVLIYDADCPLCRAYIKGLVVTGTMPAAMRIPSTALLTVMAATWPRFVRFVRDTVLFDIGRRFYAFISYNRRIMFPVAPERRHIMDLDPDLHLGYRTVFLVLLYGAVVLGFQATVGLLGNWAGVALVGHLTLALGYIVRHSGTHQTANVLDYLGHLGMSLLVGAAFQATGALGHVPMLALLGNAVMIWQLARRQRIMQLPDYLLIPFVVFVGLV